MSRPTQIYLLAVLCAAVGWLGASTWLGGGRSAIQYRGDPYFEMRNAEALRQSLRGRIVIGDVMGPEVGVALSTLMVEVRAREARPGGLAILRLAPVDVHGHFHAPRLPQGTATVSVVLGGGDVIWRAESVEVGGDGPSDPRLDPIDMTGILTPFVVHMVGPNGVPVHAGHLAWREAGLQGEEHPFTGDAPIVEGRASFLATTPSIDAVMLVPGADVEWSPGLWSGDEVHLGLGTTAVLELTGELPNAKDWTVRAGLVPMTLEPSIEYDLPASVSSGALLGTFGATRHASLPLSRAGRYRLRWWVMPKGGRRRQAVQMDGGVVDIPWVAGETAVEVPFPLVEFMRQTSGAGR